jgi:hypothetical protein
MTGRAVHKKLTVRDLSNPLGSHPPRKEPPMTNRTALLNVLAGRSRRLLLLAPAALVIALAAPSTSSALNIRGHCGSSAGLSAGLPSRSFAPIPPLPATAVDPSTGPSCYIGGEHGQANLYCEFGCVVRAVVYSQAGLVAGKITLDLNEEAAACGPAVGTCEAVTSLYGLIRTIRCAVTGVVSVNAWVSCTVTED